MKPEVLGVIPARLGSTRFPGKALFEYKGRPLLYYVWREMSRSKTINRLVIATDSRDIQEAARAFGAEVVLTSRKHRTGSDRAAEVAVRLGGQIVVNVQGDCLGLSAGPVDRAVETLRAAKGVACATLARGIEDDNELSDPNVVKVITDGKQRALWFSRYPLPYLQSPARGAHAKQFPFLAHIGVYVFRRQALMEFAGWRRSPLEKAESLEQLRLMEHGERIIVLKTRSGTVSVDSPADIRKLSRIVK